MSILVNVLLVLAGAFLADLSALLLTALPAPRRWGLGAVGVAGLALILARVPFESDPRVGTLASAAYAVGACAACVWLAADLVKGEDRRTLQRVGAIMGVSLATMIGLLVWVTTIAGAS